ncbi:MAG: ABC transporter ATP-binding protein [Anaerolineae bacterium]|nr:ABC transporter ATP-binding protein [Anaerolineae bacterium]
MNKDTNMAATFEGVAKRYTTNWGLYNVDLAVPRGKITGIIGANGSGKSTLLKLAAGLLRPTRGSVCVNGAPADRCMSKAVAYLSEADSLYPFFTVDESIQFHSQHFGDVDLHKSAEMLDYMRLNPASLVGELSRGNRERLKLVLTLSRNAALILMDEPLANLDPLLKETLIKGVISFVDMAQQTVVMATNQVADVELLLERVALLNTGRLLATGDVEDIRSEDGQNLVGWMRAQYAARAGAV